MTEVAKYGAASVRRIYADWTGASMSSWKDFLLEHSISPMQQFAYTRGKNATDGFMIIDAMDLLYTGRFSGFCIVSSDSDFTRLAARIREQGVVVYGFGERKTPKALIAACNTFMYFDALPLPPSESRPDHDASVKQFTQVKAPRTLASDSGIIAPRTLVTDSGMNATPHNASSQLVSRELDGAALVGLKNAIKNSNPYDESGYVNLAEVGNYLRRISPNLNARNYGYERLRDFVAASGMVELKTKDMGPHPGIALVRLIQE